MKCRETPCPECPWRKSNRGQAHPLGWYKVNNLHRLWNGIRTATAPGMTCHMTDPNVERPVGEHELHEDTEVQECAGAIILIARENEALSEAGGDPKIYRQGRLKPLTKDGLQHWMMGRIAFGGTMFGTGDPLPKEMADDPDIQRPGMKTA